MEGWAPGAGEGPGGGRGAGTPQTSAPPAGPGHPRPCSPRPPRQPLLCGQNRTAPSTIGRQGQVGGGGAKAPLDQAPAHHLGAEVAVGKLPHEGELPGLRPAQEVPPDPLHGFQVVVPQPVQTAGPRAQARRLLGPSLPGTGHSLSCCVCSRGRQAWLAPQGSRLHSPQGPPDQPGQSPGPFTPTPVLEPTPRAPRGTTLVSPPGIGLGLPRPRVGVTVTPGRSQHPHEGSSACSRPDRELPRCFPGQRAG